MRIFFVTNNYTPYSGGLISSLNALRDALTAEHHQVFIITLDFLGENNKPQNDKPLAQSAIASPCPPKPLAKDGATADVIRIPCPIRFMYKKNHMAIPWRSTHAIKKLIQQYKPDIIHIHHPFLLGASALHAARSYNIPCIFTYHTMYEDYAHYVPILKNFAKPLIKMIVHHFCNAVDSIIVPSNAVKHYLCAQNVKTPITVIPSPLRSFFLANNTPQAFTTIKKPFRLLLVSRFAPEKNIPFIFEVFKQLPENYRLTLVGYGTDYDAMQHLAFETLQLPPERIHFVHKPPQDELLNVYRNADLFIFPSQTDTQGLVLAESMSQGVPVIALDGPGQRDIIVNGYNGFIIENAQEAAKAIQEIANNLELFNLLKAGAYETAQKYRPNTIIQKLIAVYSQFLHQKN